MNISMPPRNAVAEIVARAASKCIRLACARHFESSSLGDVAEVVSGGTPSTDRPELWGGNIPWITPKDLGKPRSIEVAAADRAITVLGLESSSARLLPEGTVLLSSRAPIGHLAIAANPLTTNQGFKNIICSERIHNRFLFHVLRGSIDELEAAGRGNTFLEIPSKVVRTFEVPLPPAAIQYAVARFLDTLYRKLSGDQVDLPALPAPLSEQRRVVARIEELAAQIHEARNLHQQATEEAEQLMAGEEQRLWPDNALAGVPHLESLTKFLGRGKQSEQGESEHFLIKTQHVHQDRYVPTFMRLATHAAARVRQEAVAQDGDILIACSAAGCLGRVARYRADGRVASTDTHVAIARPNPQSVEPDYLYAYLRGAQGQHQLRSRERGDWKREKVGFRLTELNLNDLRRVPVPVPPLSEQRRIVAQLDTLQKQVHALKRLHAETAAELDALLPSILDQAFKGEL